VCGASALRAAGGEIVEGAEERAQGCTAYSDKTKARFDGRPDGYVARIKLVSLGERE
jgi:hypothetical protein